MAATIPPMVQAVLALRIGLRPIPDELCNRVQSIRVRSAQELSNSRGGSINKTEGSGWRHKQHDQVSHGNQKSNPEQVNNRWRQSNDAPNNSYKFTNGSSSKPAPRISNISMSPSVAPARYISKFHNGSKKGDDQILNTVILNKLNVFSVQTYDDVKQFLFQILGSDQKEFIREFTWLVFRKAAAEEKFCGLFAKLLSEIKKEYPIILEEMRKLHTTYLDIWDITDGPISNTQVDRRCRLGYSQFLAELTALEVLDSDTMKVTLETIKQYIENCLSDSSHTETVEEYIDCLRQLCGSKVPKEIRFMIRDILVKDLEMWIEQPRFSVPGLSNKSRFGCMDLRDLLLKHA